VLREVSRLLRWRHARFARFRGRHWYLTLRAPFRNWWYLATNPGVLRLVIAARRAATQGKYVMVA
jgi:hypothetical protein